jgi:hypothetical protein
LARGTNIHAHYQCQDFSTLFLHIYDAGQGFFVVLNPVTPDKVFIDISAIYTLTLRWVTPEDELSMTS